jgi:hypothetical protein
MSKYKYDPHKLGYEKISWYQRNKILVGVVGIYSLALFYIWLQKPTKETKYVEGETVSTIITPPQNFSPILLKEYLEEINMKFPDIVYAQAVLETGQFSSKVFKENHNLFGMKCARSRPFTHLGSSRGHALYMDWKMSVIDYALYQSSYLRDLRTKEQYYAYIGSHYAEDSGYLVKVKKIVEKLNWK